MTNGHFLVLFVAFYAFTGINAEIPNCSYEDTVELAEKDKLSNGSYIYEGIVIPTALIGEYNFTLGHEGEKEYVANHTRGCVCKLKSCIRLCCNLNEIYNLTTAECDSSMQEDMKLHPYVNITFDNNTVREVHVVEEFVPQRGMPCSFTMYALSAEKSIEDDWKLFENGTLFTTVNEGHYSKQEYCLQPALHEHTKKHVFKPHLCPIVNEPSILQHISVYLMMISVIFFILTILVYLFVPKLHNLNGKCLICYLTALAGSFTFLFVSFYYASEGLPCKIIGYVGYFLTICAFAWCSVISFDLWNTFRGLKYASMRPNIVFRMYNLFAWGIGAFLLIAIGLIDIIDDEEWTSGIGYYSCWIATHLTIPRIYLYGPMCIMLIFNTVMFILSALKIIEIKRRLQQSEVREDHAKRLSTNRQMYSLFLRLFFIMGIAWILELLSSFQINNIQQFSDLFNASQGIFIFVLLVLRPKVRRLVIERIRGQRNSSNGADSSNEGISLQEKTVAMPTLL